MIELLAPRTRVDDESELRRRSCEYLNEFRGRDRLSTGSANGDEELELAVREGVGVVVVDPGTGSWSSR